MSALAEILREVEITDKNDSCRLQSLPNGAFSLKSLNKVVAEGNDEGEFIAQAQQYIIRRKQKIETRKHLSKKKSAHKSCGGCPYCEARSGNGVSFANM